MCLIKQLYENNPNSTQAHLLSVKVNKTFYTPSNIMSKLNGSEFTFVPCFE